MQSIDIVINDFIISHKRLRSDFKKVFLSALFLGMTKHLFIMTVSWHLKIFARGPSQTILLLTYTAGKKVVAAY